MNEAELDLLGIKAFKKKCAEECMKEIPRSEAKVDEASDYVAYFCGLDCYDKWRHENKND